MENVVPERFARERRADLEQFVAGARPRRKGLRTFQTLPRHMRRRAMSHNLYRVPARMRERAAREMTDLSDATRRKRRRPNRIVDEHSRRQRDKRWLETHIWHAKRARMEKLWGVMLATRPNVKSTRAMYRAETTTCTAHDS